MLSLRKLLVVLALFPIFGVALNNLMNLEKRVSEPLVQFDMALFSDSDAEKIVIWCEDRDFTATLHTPEFGPRKISCQTISASFVKAFGVNPTNNLFISYEQLPAALRDAPIVIKWLAVRELTL